MGLRLDEEVGGGDGGHGRAAGPFAELRRGVAACEDPEYRGAAAVHPSGVALARSRLPLVPGGGCAAWICWHSGGCREQIM